MGRGASEDCSLAIPVAGEWGVVAKKKHNVFHRLFFQNFEEFGVKIYLEFNCGM